MKNQHAERLLAEVNKYQGIDKLLSVMAALRDPQGGCEWDLKQNYSSILPFTLEEVYEVAEAIETRDFDSLKDELGDLLFQIIFYAQLAKEEGRFEFIDIAEGVCDKLIRRHPHVFDNASYTDEKALKQAWEEQKQREREAKAKNQPNAQISVLDDIPKALPELKRAHKIQKRVSKEGFDWENTAQVWDKVNEEIAEVKQAEVNGDQENIEEEIGDLLFAVVNLSRHYKVDADIALRKANQKFEKRFRALETLSSKSLKELDLDALESLWQTVKSHEK